MTEQLQAKVGNFDWLCDFAAIEEFFLPSFTGLPSRVAPAAALTTDATRRPVPVRALVVGCGTSDLSYELAHVYDEIISVDYDPEVIKHMMKTSQHYQTKNGSRLGHMSWSVCDLLEVDESPLPHDGIDIAIDKGSLDAMIVEGSIVNLFVNIHRTLCTNGKYLVISFLSKELLETLLNIPNFFFVERCVEKQFASGKVTILLCKKVFSTDRYSVQTINALREHEKIITDAYFQESCPWLTPERRNVLLNFFVDYCTTQQVDIDNGQIPLASAHKIIEAVDPYLGYSFDLFMSDIRERGLNEECISYHVLIDFLADLQ